MTLRVEEHLDVAYVLRPHARQIGPSQIVEILHGPQDRHALVIEIQEVLQPAEAVGAAQGFNRIVGEANAVAFGERKHQLGLEAALDMDVEFGFRQLVDERCAIRHAHSPGNAELL